MNENMDVINCILNCGNPDCGGGENSESSAGTGGGISVKVIQVILVQDAKDRRLGSRMRGTSRRGVHGGWK